MQRVLAEEVRVQKQYLYQEYKQSEQYEKDIQERGQASAVIAFQAAAVQDVIASLTDEEVEQYTELAALWTKTKPPTDAQRE